MTLEVNEGICLDMSTISVNQMQYLVKAKIVDERVHGLYPDFDRATVGSVGVDLRAMLDEPLTLEPGQTELVGSGLAVWIEDPNYAGYLLPRSGLGHKHGIVLGNLVGLIDSDYTGELKMSLWNRGNETFVINPGDRVAQFVVMPVMLTKFDFVDSFDEETSRGSGGFGHSGHK